MTHKRILLLTTYPIKNPRHGGQKRADAIYQAYKRHFSVVRHSAVFYRGFYSDYGKQDIFLSGSSEQSVERSPLTGDIICGEAIYRDDTVKSKMKKILLGLHPDIIHIEQPFPYLGLKPLLEELGLHPKIVFGSQNIEAPMKREILENAGVEESKIAEYEGVISRLEADMSKESDLVVACTPDDRTAHAAMGARNLVLAKNGVAPFRSSPQAKSYWQKRFHDINTTILFVGSAHPPNWAGFMTMVGKGLGFIPYSSRIVVAGSICDFFDREIKPDALNIEDATFWLRAISAGRLSEERLGALIEQADIILLPITEGGGSNLKTAEAILADKKVVTTSHALRSFEWFADFPNVWVADNKRLFQKSIVEALGATRRERTKAQTNTAKQVLWENCLSDLIDGVKKI